MHLFYYPEITERDFTLNSVESAHCVKVLRLTANDIIYLTDGAGKLCKAKIIKPDKNNCETEIIETVKIAPERNFSLNIAIAPTKNIDRFEWFIEKATEIGIDRIIPLLCTNSERKIIKIERLKKVMISAMKQSLRGWLPEITPIVKIEKLLKEGFNGNKFIATGSEPAENHLGRQLSKNTDILILIGPEGDFSNNEIQLALKNGFEPVSLGKNRLRTETAGVVACHTVNYVNQITESS